MKNKVISLLLACLIIKFIFAPVLAVDYYSTFISRINTIKGNVADMKNEYGTILTEHSDVIESLNVENKENIITLADNLMTNDIKAKINSIKLELEASNMAGAPEVLEAISKLENDSKDVIEDNKDVIEDLKDDYANMTIDEIRQVVKKVNEISQSLGDSKNPNAAYEKLTTIYDEAHIMGIGINDKIETILCNNVDTFKEVITLDILKQTLNSVKNKDRDMFVNTLDNTLKKATNESSVRASLNDVKSDIMALKEKLLEAGSIEETTLIAFNDNQKQAIADKVKAIENDYIDFGKVVLNYHTNNYVGVLFELAYDEDADEIIEYANELLDYAEAYEENYKGKSVFQKIRSLELPSDVEDVVKKTEILVALGFIDISDYYDDYLYNKFATEINNNIEHLADEVIEYIDHVDISMRKEVTNAIKGKSPDIAQVDVKNINIERFTTIDNLKSLKARLDSQVVSKNVKLQEKQGIVNQAANYTYNIFYESILDSIEKIMGLENEKSNKAYEYNSTRKSILADSFFSKSTVPNDLGIPDGYESIVSYSNIVNGKIKTGSVMTITFSDTVTEDYTYAVLGDVYADGKINSQDYVAIRNYIMGTDNLQEINKIAADTYRNGKVNSQDYVKIKNYIMNNESITL